MIAATPASAPPCACPPSDEATWLPPRRVGKLAANQNLLGETKTMNMKLAAAAIAAAALSAGAACAADFVTVPLSVTLNAPADKAWPKINGYCQIGPWFKTTCELTSGKGAVRARDGYWVDPK